MRGGERTGQGAKGRGWICARHNKESGADEQPHHRKRERALVRSSVSQDTHLRWVTRSLNSFTDVAIAFYLSHSRERVFQRGPRGPRKRCQCSGIVVSEWSIRFYLINYFARDCMRATNDDRLNHDRGSRSAGKAWRTRSARCTDEIDYENKLLLITLNFGSQSWTVREIS